MDELDELDDLFSSNNEELKDDTPLDNIDLEDSDDSSASSDQDLITEILKSRGITDPSKIKFENEDGDVEEYDWNTLSTEDKLGILTNNETENTSDSDLDDSEIQLINAIRTSKMSPAEYINYIQQQGVDNYLQNSQQGNQYQIDDYEDDVLYLMDIMARVGNENLTDEEAQNLLDSAKQNEALFKKQVDAIRSEYKQREDTYRQQQQQYVQEQQIEQYNQFAETVENEIRKLTDFCGYELNMDESEMEEVYDFITGFDDAGVSVFGKALNDPALLVKLGWFALNGEKAINEINEYWTNEIKNVRKTSYAKGVEDAKNGKDSRNNVKITKKSNKETNSFSDLNEDLF